MNDPRWVFSGLERGTRDLLEERAKARRVEEQGLARISGEPQSEARRSLAFWASAVSG
jgi:hypothetical protein